MQEFALQSPQLHREGWEQLGEPATARSGARPVPRLHVAMDGAEASELEEPAALHNATEGIAARLLHREELLTSKPRVSPDAVAGLWTEGNARVDPAPIRGPSLRRLRNSAPGCCGERWRVSATRTVASVR